MRDFWTLYRATFASHLGLDALSDGGSAGKRAAAAVFAAVFALLGLLTGGWLSVQLVRAADAQSFPALAVEFVALVAALPATATAACALLRTVCLAGDLGILAPLPVRRITVFRAKLAFCYTETLLLSAMCLLPVLGAYAATVGGGFWFWIRGAAMLALYPLLPLFAGAVLALPLSLLGETVGRGVFRLLALAVVPLMDAALALLCVLGGSGGRGVAEFWAANGHAVSSWCVPPFSWAGVAVCGGGMTSAITGTLFALTAAVLGALTALIMRKRFARRAARVLDATPERAMR